MTQNVPKMYAYSCLQLFTFDIHGKRKLTGRTFESAKIVGTALAFYGLKIAYFENIDCK